MNSELKEYKKQYKIPIYFGSLYVIITNNVDESNKKYGDKDFDCSGYAGITFNKNTKNGYNLYYVIVESDADIKSLVHEAKHIVNKIFADRQIQLNIENDEPECYLLGWVFDKIYNTFLNGNEQ